jgi:hypothetical protein
MHIRATAPVLTLACAGALATGATAAADLPPRPVLPAAAGAPIAMPANVFPGVAHVVGRLPRGYTIVSTGQVNAPAGQQTGARVSCPFPLVPLGGGVFQTSARTSASVNSSAPTPTGWAADVNNGDSFNTLFTVTAICARAPKLYTQVSSNGVQNPPGSQTESIAQCPQGTKPLSGGVQSSAFSLSVNVNTSVVAGRGWITFENNASGQNEAVDTVVVCGKVSGYLVVGGTAVDSPPNDQSSSVASCPAGSVVIGGGTTTNAANVGVNINTSTIVGSQWESFVNNATTFDFVQATIVICAGAS